MNKEINNFTSSTTPKQPGKRPVFRFWNFVMLDEAKANARLIVKAVNLFKSLNPSQSK